MPMLTVDPNVESAETKALDAAIIKAIMGARSIGKDGRNEHSRYNYAKADDIIDEARDALAGAGVLVSTLNQWDTEFEALNWQGQNDNSRKYLVLFKVSHPESGQWRIYRRFCTYSDRKGTPWDKGLLGCQTTVLAYFLRDLLLLPRVDESIQPDQRNDTNHGKDSDMPRIDFNDVDATRKFVAWKLKQAKFTVDQTKALIKSFCDSVEVESFDDTDRHQRRALVQALINNADPVTGELLRPPAAKVDAPKGEEQSGSFAEGFSLATDPVTEKDPQPDSEQGPDSASDPAPASEGEDSTENKQRILRRMHEVWQENNPDMPGGKCKEALKNYLRDVLDGRKVADVSLGELQGVMLAVEAGKVQWDKYDPEVF